MPFYNSKQHSPILPLSNSSPYSPVPTRMNARRLSYGIKSRASHYSIPLSIGAFITLAIFFFVYTRPDSEYTRFQATSKLSLQSRSQERSELAKEVAAHEEHVPDRHMDNGVGILVNEDELIAEDDLFWDSYTEAEPLSAEEAAAEAELQAHRADVLAHNTADSLRALVWWLAEGGILPNNWEVPTKAQLKKMGSKGFEKLLTEIDHGDEEQEIFEDGWADFANRRYKIVVFSKSYCPYSRNAKAILAQYHLSPAPFFIELDHRSDMNSLQTLLNHFTDRRTVPNILLDFVSNGGSDDLTLQHAEGGLQQKFEDMMVV
ncbi:glutaredoxin [Cryptococcus wingfieldii CBS 7118]|uniref:Glutaredoxin n=1 Tax=Cryptococcus wingfieldii CBS 7118 TaxID=1295528 RepID=A0A1E3IIN1_9TREE|nr:glutaredoxin [Cryptococcus wingfieldii CBS 7118]ODN88454.1 glutaredoxin [Cryptococcus wingfieldii CBS 7118]